MAKDKTAFFCRECGAKSAVWIGRCPQCGAWNSYEQEVIHRSGSGQLKNLSTPKAVTMLMSNIECSNEQRIDLKDDELNRVLGGGLVLGSLVLIGGEPGIGKSTLLLQVALNCKDKRVLYVSGEESASQIKMRAERINKGGGNCYVLTETCVENIIERATEVQPQIIIIDSIQTMTTSDIDSSAGSISQIRESAARLGTYAKQSACPIIIVGHITKDGNLAGPKILEHMVDTVLYLEGERYFSYRIVRGVKNRFGSTNELGMFEMQEKGMVEIDNPSSVLISERSEKKAGSVIVSSIEGTKPLLIEIQSLTTPSIFGMARRTANGIDYNRLTLLIAVLEKYTGLPLGSQDVYLNIVGGIKINEPALDLGIILSAASSYKNMPLPLELVAIGEVGLTGEVRNVNMIEKRLREAEKLGFKTCIIPESNKKTLKDNYKLDIIGVKNILETMKILGLK